MTSAPTPVRAAARCIRAGLLREVGLHARAAIDDEAALGLLETGGRPSLTAAVLAGHVADAVGLALPDLTARLAASGRAAAQAGTWQAAVRQAWVSGEVAMLEGDPGAAGEQFAAAVELAAARDARKATAKGLAFLAASQAARHLHADGRVTVSRAAELAERCGALHLQWPIALIAAETDPGHAQQHLERARTILGALLRDLPSPLQAEARTRPPAAWLLS